MFGSQNNCDLLRLILAVCVMLVHSQTLSAANQLSLFPRLLNSTYSVWAFFVISGYLITMSFERSRSLRDFANKRVRRILPAYVTVVAVSAFAGAIATTLPVSAYLVSPRLYGYLLANLSFLNFLCPSLPGVFESNPYGPAVNGALWSIRSELACYVAVPLVCALASRFGRLVACVAFALVFVCAGAALLALQLQTGSPTIETLRIETTDCGFCFALGVAAYYYGDRLRGRWFAVVGIMCLAILALGLKFHPWTELLLRPVLLACAVIYVSFRMPYLGNWGRYGDISYGVYIYHFPVIQCVVAAGVFALTPLGGLALSVTVTLALAIASWFFIEAPWLSASSHYMQAFKARRESRYLVNSK